MPLNVTQTRGNDAMTYVKTPTLSGVPIREWINSHPDGFDSRDTADLIEICNMLSYRRPAYSKTEAQFADLYLSPVFGDPDLDGNYIHTILNGSEVPTVAFMAHYDTVHTTQARQAVRVTPEGLAFAPNSNCLGADCTSGVWLILEMIKAGIPGVYVVHAAEEIGCIGSTALSNSGEPWVDHIQAAISFDRFGYTSVITHQCGMRTASDVFAGSLGAILGDTMPVETHVAFVADPGGSYTDSNEYADRVPECTNLSVGYDRQHTSSETQDIVHLLDLRDALVLADWSKLVIDRDPYEPDFWWREESKGYTSRDSYAAVSQGSNYSDLLYFIEGHPDAVADWLDMSGVSLEELRQQVGY